MPHGAQSHVAENQRQDDLRRREGLAPEQPRADQGQDQPGQRLPFDLVEIRREPFLDVLLHGLAGQRLEGIGEQSNPIWVGESCQYGQDENPTQGQDVF